MGAQIPARWPGGSECPVQYQTLPWIDWRALWPASCSALLSGELTDWRYNVKTLNSPTMGEPKRATVYFDVKVHRALRLKAAETDRSVSELVNEAVRESLSEDAADLEAFKGRSRERRHKFEDVLKQLKRRGEI